MNGISVGVLVFKLILYKLMIRYEMCEQIRIICVTEVQNAIDYIL